MLLYVRSAWMYIVRAIQNLNMISNHVLGRCGNLV